MKPIDAAALRAAAADIGLIVVTEDHRIEGGLAMPCWTRSRRRAI